MGGVLHSHLTTLVHACQAHHLHVFVIRSCACTSISFLDSMLSLTKDGVRDWDESGRQYIEHSKIAVSALALYHCRYRAQM